MSEFLRVTINIQKFLVIHARHPLANVVHWFSQYDICGIYGWVALSAPATHTLPMSTQPLRVQSTCCSLSALSAVRLQCDLIVRLAWLITHSNVPKGSRCPCPCPRTFPFVSLETVAKILSRFEAANKRSRSSPRNTENLSGSGLIDSTWRHLLIKPKKQIQNKGQRQRFSYSKYQKIGFDCRPTRRLRGNLFCATIFLRNRLFTHISHLLWKALASIPIDNWIHLFA